MAIHSLTLLAVRGQTDKGDQRALAAAVARFLTQHNNLLYRPPVRCPSTCRRGESCRAGADGRRTRGPVLGSGWPCRTHRARAAAATTRRFHVFMLIRARARTKTRGNPDRGSSALHTASRRPARALCAPHTQPPDASAIARNVGHDQVFAASRRAACSHSYSRGCHPGIPGSYVATRRIGELVGARW